MIGCMMKTTDLARIRKDLENRRAALQAKLREESQILEAGPGENPDRGSLARRYADRQFNLAIHERTSAQLEQVEQALERLGRDDYGKCKNCGKQIARARLEALPHAVLCVDCKSLSE